MATNAKKKVPIDRIMSFEISPVPLSLFNDDSTLVSTEKSHFLDKLEALLPGDPKTSIEVWKCSHSHTPGHI